MQRRTVFLSGLVIGAACAAAAVPMVRAVADMSLRDIAEKGKALASLAVERVRQGRQDAQILEFPSAAAN